MIKLGWISSGVTTKHTRAQPKNFVGEWHLAVLKNLTLRVELTLIYGMARVMFAIPAKIMQTDTDTSNKKIVLSKIRHNPTQSDSNQYYLTPTLRDSLRNQSDSVVLNILLLLFHPTLPDSFRIRLKPNQLESIRYIWISWLYSPSVIHKFIRHTVLIPAISWGNSLPIESPLKITQTQTQMHQIHPQICDFPWARSLEFTLYDIYTL